MSSETSKAFDRRMREGYFRKYCQNLGVDIGSGGSPVTLEIEQWDITLGHSDATYMEGVPDDHFDYVYGSHILEHLQYPVIALRNWWRILKVGGYLCLSTPHRDLYEKKKTLPSRWNSDHKHFFLPIHGEPPDTLGLLDTIEEAVGPNYWLEFIKSCSDGCDNWMFPMEHSHGEYSIEAVLKKL